MTKQELEAYDDCPRTQGDYVRYACPLTDDCQSKPIDDAHRTLSVMGTHYFCFRCSSTGDFTDMIPVTKTKSKKQTPTWYNDLL